MLRRLLPVCLALAAACGPAQKETAPSSPKGGATIEDGKLLIESGEFEAGAVLFERIVSQRPSNAEARFYHAVCLDRLGRTGEAETEYREALRLDGELLEARGNLGLILLDRGALAEAKDQLAQVLDASGDDADAHYNLALALAAMGERDAAVARFEEAARLAPTDPLPLVGLGDLARAEGKIDSAVEHYRAALRLDPGNPMAALSGAQALVASKREDEAAAMLLAMGESAQADAVALTTAGMLLAKMGRDKEAIETYGAALGRDEGFARAHILLANALARASDFERAARHFARFIELAPDAPEADAARKGLEACEARTSR